MVILQTGHVEKRSWLLQKRLDKRAQVKSELSIPSKHRQDKGHVHRQKNGMVYRSQLQEPFNKEVDTGVSMSYELAATLAFVVAVGAYVSEKIPVRYRKKMMKAMGTAALWVTAACSSPTIDASRTPDNTQTLIVATTPAPASGIVEGTPIPPPTRLVGTNTEIPLPSSTATIEPTETPSQFDAAIKIGYAKEYLAEKYTQIVNHDYLMNGMGYKAMFGVKSDGTEVLIGIETNGKMKMADEYVHPGTGKQYVAAFTFKGWHDYIHLNETTAEHVFWGNQDGKWGLFESISKQKYNQEVAGVRINGSESVAQALANNGGKIDISVPYQKYEDGKPVWGEVWEDISVDLSQPVDMYWIWDPSAKSLKKNWFERMVRLIGASTPQERYLRDEHGMGFFRGERGQLEVVKWGGDGPGFYADTSNPEYKWRRYEKGLIEHAIHIMVLINSLSQSGKLHGLYNYQDYWLQLSSLHQKMFTANVPK
jgi:hypothetical protein